MKNFGKSNFLTCVLGIPAIIICFTMIKRMASNQASSIGIIGGADGPTAIFLASRIGPQIGMYFIVLFIILLLYKLFKNYMLK